MFGGLDFGALSKLEQQLPRIREFNTIQRNLHEKSVELFSKMNTVKCF